MSLYSDVHDDPLYKFAETNDGDWQRDTDRLMSTIAEAFEAKDPQDRITRLVYARDHLESIGKRLMLAKAVVELELRAFSSDAASA